MNKTIANSPSLCVRPLLLFVTLVASASLFGQEDARGRITGKVMDPSGAPIPNAAVYVTENSTRVKVSAATNASGAYELPYLDPGSYTLTASAQGFSSYERTNVELHAADRLTIDVPLKVGAVTESVVVTGQVPLVDTSSANQGQVTDQRLLADLPLSGGNPFTLIQEAPGVLNLAQVNHPSLSIGASSVITNAAVNGTRNNLSEYTIDGAPDMQKSGNTAYTPPDSMVAEVKVQTATYDAGVGRVPGADMNVILKSGTNLLHGALMEAHTDQHLEALTLFSRQYLYNPSTGPVNAAKESYVNPLNILNRYSAVLTGPVILPKIYDGHNRTFFSVAYEGINRPVITLGSAVTVPTDAERTGDFSALLKAGSNYQIYDPATIASDGAGHFTRQPFANNIIPASRLDRTAQALLKYYPEANTTGLSNGENNYIPDTSQANNQTDEVVKVDHNFSERRRAFLRWDHETQDYISDPLVGTETNVTDRWWRTDGVVIDFVNVFSPTLLNDSRIGFTRFDASDRPIMSGFNLTGAGFSPTLTSELNPVAIQFPGIAITNYQSLGNAANDDEATNYFIASNDLSWSKGSAILHFGAEFRLYRDDSWNIASESPSMTFAATYTNGPLDSSAAAPIGQGLASFLLGIPSSGTISQTSSYADQSYNYAFYFQSDWRLTRTLTINTGLRYDYDSPVTERYNRSVKGFDFGVPNPISAQALANYAKNPVAGIPVSQFQVDGGLTFAGVNGQSRQLWDSSHLNFAPRLGLAWQVRPNTTVRAGYGIFYVPTGADYTAATQTGFTSTTSLNPTLNNGLNFIASIENPFPSGLIQPVGAANGLGTYLGQSVSFFPDTLKSPYMQRWSADVQHQLPLGIFLDASYVGNRGTHLAATRQFDTLPASDLSTLPVRDTATINNLTTQVANPFYPLLPGTNLSSTTVAKSQLLLPYPEFSGVSSTQPVGYSYYHALQLLAQRRFANGFTAQFNWVWSKFMEATSFLNASDPVPSKVISDLDRTQILHGSGIYELPFGHSKPLLSGAHGVVRQLVEGWQVEAMWQFNTGAPLGFGNALLVAPLQDVALPSNQRTIAKWFNTAAFNTASGSQLADNIVTMSVRFSGVRAPGVDNWNFSAVKNFSLTERFKLQFRTEFLDAFNHTDLSPPNTSPTAAAFGSITGAANQPRFIFFTLKLTF